MVARLEAPRHVQPMPIAAGSPSFGTLLHALRVKVGLSQNQLARNAGIDPAYVNRLERAPDDSVSMPRRGVVLAFWMALATEGREQRVYVGADDRERLLVASGHVPEVIVQAGGWDAYVRRLRKTVIDSAGELVDRFSAALEGGEDADA